MFFNPANPSPPLSPSQQYVPLFLCKEDLDIAVQSAYVQVGEPGGEEAGAGSREGRRAPGGNRAGGEAGGRRDGGGGRREPAGGFGGGIAESMQGVEMTMSTG